MNFAMIPRTITGCDVSKIFRPDFLDDGLLGIAQRSQRATAATQTEGPTRAPDALLRHGSSSCIFDAAHQVRELL